MILKHLFRGEENQPALPEIHCSQTAPCPAEPVALCPTSPAHLDAAVAGSELAVFLRGPTTARPKPAGGSQGEVCG